MNDGYCDAHRARVSEAGDAKSVAGALIVNKALSTGRFPPDGVCWACALTEPEFQEMLREGAVLVAKAEAYGGTYTTPGLILLGNLWKPTRSVVLSDDKRLVHRAWRDLSLPQVTDLRGMVAVPCQLDRGLVPTKKQRHRRYATYTRRPVTCVFCLAR